MHQVGTDPAAVVALVDAVVDAGEMALKFGRVNRVTFHPDGKRYESDTDHTVMLTILAGSIAAEYTNLDVGLVVQYASVHDLPEFADGDTSTLRVLTPAEKQAKKDREREGYDRIVRRFGLDLPWIDRMIAAYERLDTREAQFVKELDKSLPKITHLLNGLATLRAAGVTTAELAERLRVQELEIAEYSSGFPILAAIRGELVRRVLAKAATVLDAGP